LIAAGHSTKLHALYLVPAVFWGIELLLARRSLAGGALLAVSVALQLWRNHPQISYYTLLLGGLYFIAVLLFDRPAGWRGRGLAWGLALAVIALIFAVGMVMEPYAAVVEYKPFSIRGGPGAFPSDSGGGANWDYATAWSHPPEELLCFLFPAWFGLEGEAYWGRLPFTQSTHYVGAAALLLALLGLIWSSGRRRWLLLGLSGLVLIIGFGRHFPLLYRPMYELLPMFKSFRVPSMIYAMLSLPVAYLAADGLGRISAADFSLPAKAKGHRARAHPLLRRWPAVTLVLGGLLLLWIVAGSWTADQVRASGGLVSPREAGQLDTRSLAQLRDSPLERLAGSPLGARVVERASRLQSSVLTGLLLLAACAVLIEGRRRGWVPPAVAAGLLVLLVTLDLWVIDRKFYHPRPRRESQSVLQSDDVIRTLQEQEGIFRIAPLTAQGLRTNRYAAFGLESVSGYQPAKLRIYDDLIRSGALTTLPVLSMLNARFLVTDRPLDPNVFPHVMTQRGPRGAELHVHENPGAMPRAWFTTDQIVLSDAGAVLDRLQSGEFDPSRTALILEAERGAFPGRLSAGEVLGVARNGPHDLSVDVRVEGPDAGLLVLSEIVYPPGWVLTIDGEEADILRVNYILRAVAVDPGDHRIEMRAISRARATGVWVSRGSVLAVVLMAVAGCWSRRRREAPVPSE